MEHDYDAHICLLERLWAHVDTSGDCWVWTGGNAGGKWPHGRMTMPDDRGPGHRHSSGVHRVAWELAFGPVPDGLMVCHHCDNPLCCRPSHLFLGTNQENLHDAMRKRRIAGKLHPLERERLIAALVAGEMTMPEAAREAGVVYSTVFRWLKTRGLTAAKRGSRWPKRT